MTDAVQTKAAPDGATVEAALVAACHHRKFDRSQAFGTGAGSRGVRILAGAALKARSGVAATNIAPLLKLSPPELSPSMLARYAITTDDLLEVVERLGSSEVAPAPVYPVAEIQLAPGAPPPFRPRERKQAKAARPKLSAIAVTPPAKAVGVRRLKPLTPAIARWAGYFLASPIWTADEVAELFGVHPDALIDGLAAA